MIFNKIRQLFYGVCKPIIVLVILGGGLGNIPLSNAAETYSLYDTLTLYGYSNDTQKKSIEFLLQQSNIIPQGQSFQDVFPQRENREDLIKDVVNFVKLIQQRFVVREGTQERWQTTPLQWMEEEPAAIRAALTELDIVEEIQPPLDSPDVVCILGATYYTMKKRIDFASRLYSQGRLNAQYLILLAGERRVTVGIDGSESDLLRLAKKHNKETLSFLTETELIKELYENSDLVNKFKVEVIDTPARHLPRPTTETTVIEFSVWLKAHQDVKNVIFVSSQPYVKYQEAIIAAVFKNRGINIEPIVVGPEVNSDIDPYKMIEGLGSRIWAQTPFVLAALGGSIKDEATANEFKELYRNCPMIYSVLDFGNF